MVLPRGVGAPLLVRDANPADAAAIGEVHAEAWRVAHRDLFDGHWLRRLVEERRQGWADEMAGRTFERNTLLLAERGDRVVAFAYFGPQELSDAEVFDLYAHPSVWGSGVAWTLMDAAWDQIVEARLRRVRAWTVAGANRARHFYESFGFSTTGRRRERDFGDGRPVLEVEYLRTTR
ncbi:GNAT family N-acetyltransferase [Actinophytocola sp.]|uniref:GNAT family N-acetyltransferase n=1 Tax=Actinophytocola sp. TaxID=1872138 RepID=UPI002ED28F0B